MAIFSDHGLGRNFLNFAFETGLKGGAGVFSVTATEAVLHNSLTGSLTTLTGSGLLGPTGSVAPDGIVTGFTIRGLNGDTPSLVFAATDLAWNAGGLIAAGMNYGWTGNETGIVALLSQQPVIWDAAGAVQGAGTPLGLGFGGATSDMILLGSRREDVLYGGLGQNTLSGGDGDDWIWSDSRSAGDRIDAGTGDDTVVLQSGAAESSLRVLSHRSLEDRTGIVATISDADVSIIDKGSFGQTTLLAFARAIRGAGLFIEGTGLDDRFVIALQAGVSGSGGLVGLVPGRGSDLVQATGKGRVGLDFSTDGNGAAAAEGARVNLQTGTVANDGFGFAERLDIAAQVALAVTLTAGDDHVVARGADDTLQGGAGTDRLDYGQGGFAAGVRVDLGRGTATGTASGTVREGPAVAQVVAGFETLTGTRDHGDTLAGGGGANVIAGLGGGDTIHGDGFRAAYAAPQAAQIWRLYQAAFDRVPDTGGLHDGTASLVEGTRTLAGVAAEFTGSAAFQAVHGALDNTGFATLLYRNVLDRAPDAGGLAAWVAELQGGMARAQVVLGFSESREFVTKTLVEARGFVEARSEAGWSDDVFRLYQATLDRAPDAAGFLDWLGRLAGGQRFLSMVDGLVGSAEFRATYGALDDTAFVALLYQNVLDRAPDAGGLADWAGRLAGGATRAEVVRGFAQSREFTAATAEGVIGFLRTLGGGDTLDGGGGDNRVWGGALADTFVFDRDDGGQTRVMDFEDWDILAFRDFGYGDAGDIRAHMVQAGADVMFRDQGVTVVLAGLRLADLADDHFAVL